MTCDDGEGGEEGEEESKRVQELMARVKVPLKYLCATLVTSL